MLLNQDMEMKQLKRNMINDWIGRKATEASVRRATETAEARRIVEQNKARARVEAKRVEAVAKVKEAKLKKAKTPEELAKIKASTAKDIAATEKDRFELSMMRKVKGAKPMTAYQKEQLSLSNTRIEESKKKSAYDRKLDSMDMEVEVLKDPENIAMVPQIDYINAQDNPYYFNYPNLSGWNTPIAKHPLPVIQNHQMTMNDVRESIKRVQRERPGLTLEDYIEELLKEE